jgi:uncharacterized membrane protein YkvA (DUF1232 family)
VFLNVYGFAKRRPGRFIMGQEVEYTKYFQSWIDTFSDDIRLLASILKMDDVDKGLKRLVVGTLNYGLKQLDLIPDFYAPVGLIDDAMIIRIFANLAIDYIVQMKDERVQKNLIQMAEDDTVIKDFVGEEIYTALVKYVKALPDKKVRRRDSKIILGNQDILEEFLEDIEVELKGYIGSKITDPESVEKDLKSFLKLKLVG